MGRQTFEFNKIDKVYFFIYLMVSYKNTVSTKALSILIGSFALLCFIERKSIKEIPFKFGQLFKKLDSIFLSLTHI